MAFLRRKKKGQPQKIWERQTLCFHSPGKNLGLSHTAVRRKKQQNKTLPLGVMQDSQTSPEQRQRVQMAPRFAAISQGLAKPKTGKNTAGLLHTDCSPGLRAALAVPHRVKVIKDLLPHKKPSPFITKGIPLQKKLFI